MTELSTPPVYPDEPPSEQPEERVAELLRWLWEAQLIHRDAVTVILARCIGKMTAADTAKLIHRKPNHVQVVCAKIKIKCPQLAPLFDNRAQSHKAHLSRV